MTRARGHGRRLGLAALACARDTTNVIRFGTGAPRFAERIWIDPNRVKRVSHDPGLRRPQSAKVIGGDWDKTAETLGKWDKYNACISHWTHGVSWEDTGIIAALTEQIHTTGPVDGLKQPKDVVERYRKLDTIFCSIAQRGQLASVREHGEHLFRAWGDILIHVGRGPEAILGRGGHHRLAIAHCLGLEVAPAQIGCVHPSALASWTDIVVRSNNRPATA